jgi:AraC-like DNA-binding protein
VTLTFSTDQIRPHERFDHWCEVRARNLFGVTISLRREERLHFHGRFSASAVGGAVLSEMQASPYRVSRSAADISRASSDSLCLYQQIGGASWFDARSGGEFIVPAGGLAVSHTDLPYLTTPVTSHGFDLRILKIPLAGRDALAPLARDLPPSLLRNDPRLQRAISAAFNVLVAEAARYPEANYDRAVEHLAQLALLASARVSIGSPESRAALRFGLLQAVRDVLRCNYYRFDLSPATVASEFAISVRQMHLLFEPTGISFSRTLLAMRLQEARQRLKTMPAEPVADIAYACGFDSLATFYRAFRNVYGMTPSDARHAADIDGITEFRC